MTSILSPEALEQKEQWLKVIPLIFEMWENQEACRGAG